MLEPPSPVTPDWPLYRTEDADAAECEVGKLIAAFVRAVKPRTLVEIGTHLGATAELIGRALEANGVGRLHTFELDPGKAARAERRLQGLPVRVHTRDAAGAEEDFDAVDLLFVDGDGVRRETDFLRWAQKLRLEGLVFVHDALKDEDVFLALRRVEMPKLWVRTPRGLVIFQKEAAE